MLRLLVQTAILFAQCCLICYCHVPDNYGSLPAAEKLQILWNSVLETRYNILPTEAPETNDISSLSPTFARKIFTIASDEYPPNRHRELHAFGSVGQVVWKMNKNSIYTGIFSPGSRIPGLARLSLAFFDMSNIIPAVTIKLLVDELPSINIFAVDKISGLGGQGTDRNFFARNLSTRVPAARSYSQLIGNLGTSFAQAIKKLPGGKCNRPADALALPLLHHALYAPDGEEVIQPRAPTALTFVPNPLIAMSSTDERDFREVLGTIPANTMLYQIYADGEDNGERLIGKLVLKRQFVASEYGDQTLFFQHHGKRC